MGILDLFGNNNNRGNRSFNNDLVDNYLNSKVVGVTEKGIVLEVPDTRTSTTLAGRAASRTNGGQLPNGFGRTAALVPFSGDTGKQTLDILNNAGIKQGSTLGELYGVISGDPDNPLTRRDQRRGSRLREILRDAFDGDGTFNRQQTGNLLNLDTRKADQSLITDQTYRGGNKGAKPYSLDTRQRSTNDPDILSGSSGNGIFNETTDNGDILGLGNYLENIQREIAPLLTKYNF